MFITACVRPIACTCSCTCFVFRVLHYLVRNKRLHFSIDIVCVILYLIFKTINLSEENESN